MYTHAHTHTHTHARARTHTHTLANAHTKRTLNNDCAKKINDKNQPPNSLIDEQMNYIQLQQPVIVQYLHTHSHTHTDSHSHTHTHTHTQSHTHCQVSVTTRARRCLAIPLQARIPSLDRKTDRQTDRK